MKILVTGAKGMLGTNLRETLARDHHVVGVDLEDFDITDETATREAIVGAHPELVVHAAAWTDVDGCERDPGRAFAQNGRGTLHVAMAAVEIGATLVYVSTDFVFDGSKGKPYTEFDPPNPLNAYGASKLAGEEAVRQL
ncbi:MAG: NAD(P)-dependent oxidoreductase, partial [Armatimonadetes bacterium]|nr:NAD(P)-dependent oxidoreductase [Armatimonadota bacterium]